MKKTDCKNENMNSIMAKFDGFNSDKECLEYICCIFKNVDKMSEDQRRRLKNSTKVMMKRFPNMINLTTGSGESLVQVLDALGIDKNCEIVNFKYGGFRSSREQELFEKMQKGDKFAATDFVNMNMGLVNSLANHYCGIAGFEEGVSLGLVGLAAAISTFDSSKGWRFTSYAARVITNEILRAKRHEDRMAAPKNVLYFYDEVGIDHKSGETARLIDLIKTDGDDPTFDEVDERVGRYERARLVKQIIENDLTEMERVVIKNRYGLGGKKCLSQREVGEIIGYSRAYAALIELRAISKIKKLIEQRAARMDIGFLVNNCNNVEDGVKNITNSAAISGENGLGDGNEKSVGA